MNLKSTQKHWLLAAIGLFAIIMNGCTPVKTEPACTGSECPITVGSIDLLVSSQQLPSDGKTPVTITVRALSTNNSVAADQPVTFSADSGSLVIVSSSTDSNGLATATITPGTDKSNRTIKIGASVNGVSKTTTVQVSGTTITTTGVNAVTINTPLTIKATARDSSGAAIPSATFTASSSAASMSVTPSTGTSDLTGEISVIATPTASGSFTVNFSALGATSSHAVTVDGDAFGIDAGSALKNGDSLLVNTGGTITATWSKNGVAQANKVLTFSSTRGSFTGGSGSVSVTTDSNGKASATIQSASTGSAAITISGPNGSPSTSLQITYITNQASKVDIQPTITSIAANTNGSTANKISLPTLVRDSNNNLVKDAKVTFSITTDPSGGSLSSGSATTDLSGVATVDYIAGTSTSGQNGVTITATVAQIGNTPITPVSKSINLTVGGQGLFIRIGTDNSVGAVGGLYTKTYYALVTDAAGAAVKDAPITFVIKPLRYFKGFHTWSSAAKVWVTNVTATCPNEDLNYNGTKDSGEDLNGSGDITPGNQAGITPSAITDSKGFASADTTYTKDNANWIEVQVTATTKVSGTEATHSATFTLPGAASDYTTETVSPPGSDSKFGTSGSCLDSN